MSEFISKGALISQCQKYRYTLSRHWGNGKDVLFIMLNPSTADAMLSDPTITRCVQRAKNMGYGKLHVANIFAYRSTDPKELYTANDPIGWRNDELILKLAKNADLVICGWGKHGKIDNRGKEVLSALWNAGIKTMALKLNKDGTPAHPLYIGYDVEPFEIKDWYDYPGKR